MKYFTWFSAGVALFLAFSLCAPLDTQAASSKKSTVQTKISKKAVAGKAASSVKKKEKKSPTSAKATASKKKSSPAAQASNREVWLKRAQESDLLTGKASWYGSDFHNKPTASGVKYDMYTFTAAHRTLPLGTVVKVTDEHNGRSVMVCVTDRGPYVRGRIIDVSYAAAKKLDLNERGVGKVKLEVVSDAKGTPLKPGHAYFVRYASDNGKNTVGPFSAYADAAAMHEALRQAHPEAEVILDNAE